jgi:hypothetical protein
MKKPGNEIEHCQQRIAEEQAIARAAGSSEASEMHAQMAMLYKIQLEMLKNRRR